MRNNEDGRMETQCNGWQMEFHGLGTRRVVSLGAKMLPLFQGVGEFVCVAITTEKV